MNSFGLPGVDNVHLRTLEGNLQKVKEEYVKSLSTTNTKIAFSSNHVTWSVKGVESAKTEIKVPGIAEIQAILLTPVGTLTRFRVFEGGPYVEKFNVVGSGALGEEVGAGIEAFFFWLAIGK